MPKIAMCSIDPIVGALERNLDLIVETYQRAAAAGAELVVTPEMSLTGYPLEDLTQRPAFLAAVERAHAELIARIRALNLGASILFGHPTDTHQNDGNRRLVYNSATLYDPATDRAATVHKKELPNYGVFDEKRNYLEAEEVHPIEWRGHPLGVMICEDGWFPRVANELAAQGAQALIWVNGSPFAMGKNVLRRQHAFNRMEATGLPVIYVNLVGGQDELVFDGDNFACGGDFYVEASLFCSSMQLVDIDFDAGTVRPPAALTSVRPTGVGDAYLAKVLGLRDYAGKQGFSSVVIGMSGGIDSAAVASICVDALGAENVHLVRLPSRYSSSGSLTDAASAQRLLGCPMRTIAIEPMVNAMRDAYSLAQRDAGPEFPDRLTGVADENAQARVRGAILMAISNQEGHLLVTTGNKSEVAVGYSTLYGDMAGGFNALKDLYKTEVSVAAGRDARTGDEVDRLVEQHGPGIVQWRNALTSGELQRFGLLGPAGRTVPVEIETKAESAELAPDQKDSDSLPRYPVLDGILRMLVDRHAGVEETIAAGFARVEVERVNRLVNRAEYKRRQAAPGPKVSGMQFGRDRRMPIVNGWMG